MNSNYGKSNSFDFDLGLNKSGGPRSLNDQKNKNTTPYSPSPASSYSAGRPGTTSSWTSQPANKPAWTHQPAAPIQSGPTSMVGDIFGKTWSSGAPAGSIGVVGLGKKDPNLFGDLLSSALGQNKGSNVPLKNAAPANSSKNSSSFSMGGVADSLPKPAASTASAGFGSYNSSVNVNSSANLNVKKAQQPMKGGMASNSNSNKDPFGSLVDFSAKPSSGGIKSGGNNGSSNKSGGFGDDSFGDFKNAAPKHGSSDKGGGFGDDPFGDFTNAAPKPASSNKGGGFGDDPFGDFQNAPKPSGPAFSSSSSGAASYTKVEDFGFGFSQPQSQSQPQPGVSDFDALFQPNTSFEEQEFSGGDDWDRELGGGNDSGGPTTELDGLPPPPAGVSSASAKSKGVDNYKNGQFADAIKWLSWAVILLEKARDNAGVMEVLTCRASSYKEVGEYKKAVADCTKALDIDGKNVAILVQRALLYESMEKYRLGAEDLRTVMNLDPGNRVARSTIHRLTKMAEM